MYHKRIRRIAVEGLYDLYDHDVPLNTEDRVTILHGPNGVGKTNLLWMLRYAKLMQLKDLRVPFKRFTIEFDDNSQAVLSRGDEYEFSLPVVYLDVGRMPSVHSLIQQSMEDARCWGASDLIKSKIARFEDRLNSRLLNKTVTLSPTKGFNLCGYKGKYLSESDCSFAERLLVTRTALSIFGMPAGGLLLLSEPERDSHVMWQQHVIPDLLEDTKENWFDVLLTTHSPDIIGPYERLTVGLFGMVKTT